MFFVIGFQIGTMYFQHHIETDDTFSEWLDMEKECKEKIINWDKIEIKKNSYLEYTCKERVQDYKKLIFFIRIEMVLVFLMSFLDYIKDPKNHWLKDIIKFFREGLKYTKSK